MHACTGKTAQYYCMSHTTIVIINISRSLVCRVQASILTASLTLFYQLSSHECTRPDIKQQTGLHRLEAVHIHIIAAQKRCELQRVRTKVLSSELAARECGHPRLDVVHESQRAHA